MPDARDACRVLNEAFAADAAAVKCLLSLRVPCNWSLARHLSIAVEAIDPFSPATVGVLGLVNGIVGTADEAVAARYSAKDALCPGELIGFVVVKPTRTE